MIDSHTRSVVLRRLICAVFATVLLVSTGGQSVNGDETSSTAWRNELLTQAGVDLNTPGVLRFLRSQTPSSELRVRIEKAILRLGSPRYTSREAATAELRRIGPYARPELVKAAATGDSETRARAEFLLQFFDNTDDPHRRDMRILAALNWLTQYPAEEVPATLFALTKIVERPALRNAFRRAIWAAAEASHSDLFETSLRSESPLVAGAAAAGLEIARGADAVDLIVPMLKHPSDEVQLDAARAIASHRPQLAIETCVRLLKSPASYPRVQAAQLLGKLTGESLNFATAKNREAAITDWQQRAKNKTGGWSVKPVGIERLEIRSVGLVLAETFSEPARSFTDSYGSFQFDGPEGTSAAVVAGQLELHSRLPECDQRLAITPSVLLGDPLLPRAFTVHTKMGGSADGSGAYHVGVSIGKAKVLFHPGYTGGGFRVEDVDTHRVIVANTSLGFNPLDRQVYDTTIRVRDRGGETIEFAITIKDIGNVGKKFERVCPIPRAACGPLDRIGLERSGRTGGPAIFSGLQIIVDE